MSKSKKKNVVSFNSIEQANKTFEAIIDKQKRSIAIREAQIKDDFCNYNYEITTGKPIGFTHRVTGKGIIDNDMKEAFSKLNVHLAVIDDVYKHSDIQIGNIDAMHNDDLALLYTVTGFKIKGGEENESIILIGNKFLSAGSRMELESPKIVIDSLSSYKWYNELKAASDKCREEVALYHDGKYTVVQHEEEDKEDLNQGKLGFGKGDAADNVEEENTIDEFENARVN